MPVTQRKRSFQLFRRLKFCSGATDDENTLDIDKMILHTLDCLGALQCVMGRYDTAKAKVFWEAVTTISEIGMDSVTGQMDRRHPGASQLIRAFPNDAKATDGRGWLPMHWAAVCDNIDYEDVRTIAKADPLATVKGYNQPISANPGHLIAAVRHPDMKVVKILYDFYPRMAYTRDNDGDLPLHYAARCTQSIEMIQYLLQANPSATKVKGESDLIPLQCAIYNQHPPSRYEIVKKLLQADVNSAEIINPDGDTALHLAVELECDVDVLRLLISANPAAVSTANDVGMLPLHMACFPRRNTTEIVKIVEELLLVYPDGVHVENSEMFLPVHIAAQYSTVDVLKLLINLHPESVTTVASDGSGTPLHRAIDGHNEAVVNYLCNTFPNCLKIPDGQGYLPLHVAAGCDNINMLKVVYHLYPDAIKTFSGDGRLPLHFFAIDEYDEDISENDGAADILRFLIKAYPESVDIPDANGCTPFSLCRTDSAFCRRLFLRAKPSLNYEEYVQLNYAPRKMAMFLSFAAINADGEPSIWCKLRETNIELLKLAVSFL
jgi:ankyrin repeat protein